MAISEDLQKLNPGVVLEFFELDTSVVGGSVYRWYDGVNELNTDVTWQGNVYTRLPIEASGFERRSNGATPRPTLKVANLGGALSALVRANEDLANCKVTRTKTLLKYLDAVNFAAGNVLEDPTAVFGREIWYIDRKVMETRTFIEFELASALDLAGVRLPRRQFIQNHCLWRYRSQECGYSGGAVATEFDVPTSDINQDKCSHKIKGCKLRYGSSAILPFGGFPGAGLTR